MEQLQDREWLRQKYVDENLSMAQIGKLLGVTKHPVSRAIKKLGLEARKHTSKYPELNDKEWLRDQYEAQKKSVRQIADEINATVGTVHSALTHMGIHTRNPKESLALLNYDHSISDSLTSTNDDSKIAQLETLIQAYKNKFGALDSSKPNFDTATNGKDIGQLLEEKSGIRLDIGGGSNPNPGFVNIDILPMPQVDIVWDLEETPWPLPDECVITATASHVLEHINPHKGVFIRVMDEIWRVMKPYGQFAFVVPHGESPGFIQDPTHCNPMNETTMHYFDPDPEGANVGPALYNFYHPKPWKVVKQYFNYTGNLEVLLEKRPMDKTYMGNYPPEDITKEVRK